LIGDLISGNEDANFGFIAHIIGEKITGPRGDAIRSPLLADDPANLMLLCGIHHKLIDIDEKDFYPESRLLEIKAAHEDRISIVSDLTPDRATHILRYSAKIGDHESPVSLARVRTAVLPGRYAADGKSIGIEIVGNSQTDGEDAFWSLEPENLGRQFELKVRTAVAERSIAHLSVFALAPIPLLALLGSLLGDITPMEIFQLHREPAGWNWASDGERITFEVVRPKQPRHGKPSALVIALSASITIDRIHAAIGDDCSIWEIRATTPGNDCMRYREDLADFRRLLREIYAEIKITAASDGKIHVFPAVPISPAIEIGRVRMPKADLPLIIYDQVKDRGFLPRLEIS
jgi:hypothetical protein